MTDITTLDEASKEFDNFKKWWHEQLILGINPFIVFRHFEKFFKPQWQSQQKETKPTGGGITAQMFAVWIAENRYEYLYDKGKYIGPWGNYAEYTVEQLYPIFLEENPILVSEPTGLRWVKENPKDGVDDTFICLIQKKQDGETSIKPAYVHWRENRWVIDEWEIIKWLDEDETEETKPVEDKENVVAVFKEGKLEWIEEGNVVIEFCYCKSLGGHCVYPDSSCDKNCVIKTL